MLRSTLSDAPLILEQLPSDSTDFVLAKLKSNLGQLGTRVDDMKKKLNRVGDEITTVRAELNDLCRALEADVEKDKKELMPRRNLTVILPPDVSTASIQILEQGNSPPPQEEIQFESMEIPMCIDVDAMDVLPIPVSLPIRHYLPYVRDEALTKKYFLDQKYEHEDYSQEKIIERLNLYIDTVNAVLKKRFNLNDNEYKARARKPISTAGQCHGISLYRAYLQGKRKINDYREQLAIIMHCTPEEMLREGSQIFERFIANESRGQEPGEYINRSLSQEHVSEILEMEQVHSLPQQTYTSNEFETKLANLIQDETIMTFTGYHDVEEKDADGNVSTRRVGHTVTLNCQEGRRYFYDCNYQTGDDRCIAEMGPLREGIWDALTATIGFDSTKPFAIRIQAVRIPEPMLEPDAIDLMLQKLDTLISGSSMLLFSNPTLVSEEKTMVISKARGCRR